MLKWEILFLRKTQTEQDIMFSRYFVDGRAVKPIIEDSKKIFINFISLFPRKDIVRIELGIRGNLLYSFYYIDKTHFDNGFLGVFGCSEHNTKHPFDWSETEFKAKNIFNEYFKRLVEGRLNDPRNAQNFLDWMDNSTKDYYKDFISAKEKHFESKSNKTKGFLADTFARAGEIKDEKDDLGMKKKSKKHSQKLEKLQKMPYTDDDDIVTKRSAKWELIHKKWKIMFLNSYGNPLVEPRSFVNGEPKRWGNKEEIDIVSLEGMTYSALYSFVGRQNLNLKSMQVRKPDNKGFEYIFFNVLKIKDQDYLLIFQIDNWDPSKKTSVDELWGKEEYLLEKIGSELKKYPVWFDKKGQLKQAPYKKKIKGLIHVEIKKLFGLD